jgi:hypothetical protein
MPTYTFQHKETQEVKELFLKMSEREKWLQDNPEYTQIHDKMTIGDPVRLGLTKPPSDFSKYIIGKVAEMPGSTIKQNYKFGIPKEY